VINSINQGIPISTGSPRAKIAVNFNELAHRFNGAAVPEKELPQEQKRSLFKNLFAKAERSE
jgi:septum formation inhibitor-activating ATPase MinD